jgi:hypothetical protein
VATALLIENLAAVKLPYDGTSDPHAVAEALDGMTTADTWRYCQTLFKLVHLARALVGTPRHVVPSGDEAQKL